MAIEDQTLWGRLEAAPIELTTDGLTLVERLTHETALSAAQAEVIVEEYRRYLYLLAARKEKLAPPPAIQRCIKEHRSYNRDLHKAFMQEVVAKPVSLATPEDKKDFATAYGHTLKAYREVFGESPPRGVWPSLRMLRHGIVLALPFMIGFMLGFMSLFSGSVWWGVFWMVVAFGSLIGYRKIGPWALEKADSMQPGD